MDRLDFAKIPKTFEQQSRLCSRCPDLDAVTESFRRDVVRVLELNFLPPIESFGRTKTEESIARKRAYRRRHQPERFEEPIVDIHAVTIVLEEPRAIEAAAKAIFSQWPTPDLLFNRMPSLSDYSKPDIRPRAESSPHYQATHIRVAIPDGARIAEVKLYTPQDKLIDSLTRDEYEQRYRRALEE